MLPQLLLAGGAYLLLRELAPPAPIRVFVSYDHSEDARYRYLLDAWCANPKFRFTIDRRSPCIAINSSDAGSIKRVLTRKLKECDCLLVLVGSRTKERDWVRWEIQRAQEEDIDIPVVAVKLGRFASPPELLGANTIWAKEFSEQVILEALEEAAARL